MNMLFQKCCCREASLDGWHVERTSYLGNCKLFMWMLQQGLQEVSKTLLVPSFPSSCDGAGYCFFMLHQFDSYKNCGRIEKNTSIFGKLLHHVMLVTSNSLIIRLCIFKVFYFDMLTFNSFTAESALFRSGINNIHLRLFARIVTIVKAFGQQES